MSFETRRVDRNEYDQLVLAISQKLESLGEKIFAPVVSYFTKPDFGDIDILILSSADHRKIVDAFEPTEVYHNSDCFSFDYKGVQVDFIFCKPENFVISCYYFAYNDLGNLLGRIFHKMGLKFGHDGLSMVVRDDTQVIGEISLSKNIDEILEFGGYSVDRYHEGFETLEDIFKYVVSSKFYSYEIFDLDNRNYRARVRDRKRKTYTEFLKWAEVNANDSDYRWASNKADYLPSVLHRFRKVDEYFSIIRNHSRNLTIREKFNGELVSKITGLTGKELGAFIAAFRKIFPNRDLEIMSPSAIESEIVNFSRGFV